MTKHLIKILLTFILILILTIIYLSVIGIKTDKFNNQIKKNILKIDNKVNFVLNEVTYLINPYNFSINITTKNPQILIEDSKLDIKSIKTNISLKSLINEKFLIDDLLISTKEIKFNDLILLARTLHNTPKLFILNTIIKDGFITADINVNFDSEGKIKENYQVEGFIKKTKLDIMNKLNVKDLNLSFNISKNKYSLSQIESVLNDIVIKSPLIQIEEKKDLYLINGTLLNKNKKLEIKDLKPILGNLLNDLDLKEIEFSSTNNFSFTINKKLKFDDLKIETTIDLDQLTFTKKHINLDHYLPNFKEEI